jgi:hypothetical protein
LHDRSWPAPSILVVGVSFLEGGYKETPKKGNVGVAGRKKNMGAGGE